MESEATSDGLPARGARLLRPFVLAIAIYVLPLLGAPKLLASPQLLTVVALFFALDLVQPSLNRSTARHETDGRSLQMLVFASLVCQVSPVIEWAYFSQTQGFHLVTGMVGVTLLVGGTMLRAWSIRTLGRFFSAQVELQDQHRLVRGGPYRWIRHPSYTGAILFLLGVPILLETPVSMVCCVLLLGGAYAYRIPVEERLLRKHFGEEFANYERETKRLLPYLW